MNRFAFVTRVVVGLVLCDVTVLTTTPLVAAPQERAALETFMPVAVFVFSNITGEAADDWMGAGIAETVATGFDGVDGLMVIRAGALETWTRPASGLGAFNANEARWTVTGGYQRVEDRIRITARITDTETTHVVQSAIVDGAVDELFLLQDRLAAQIREGLVAETNEATLASTVRGPKTEKVSIVNEAQTDRNRRSVSGSAVDDSPVARANVTDTPQGRLATLVLTSEDAGGKGLLPSERYRVEPVQVEQGPQIDGQLDEEVWQQAAVIDDFIQQEPSEGDPATERTVVRLLYDAANLYIGVEAYDSQASGIIATEMRRDSLRLLDEDNFQVILDTFQDRRSGYMFVTSPLGAKLEQQVAEEGEGGWRGTNTSKLAIYFTQVTPTCCGRGSPWKVSGVEPRLVRRRFDGPGDSMERTAAHHGRTRRTPGLEAS